MFIPTWIATLLLWAVIITLLIVTLGLLALACEWGLRKAFHAGEQVLAVIGALAAFHNFTKTILNAADGGQDWVNSFIHPRDPAWNNRWDKKSWRMRNPSIYFQIVPHPEAWKPWMRWVGVKKP